MKEKYALKLIQVRWLLFIVIFIEKPNLWDHCGRRYILSNI